MTSVAFLLIVVVVCAIGGLVLWVRHREPTTLESGLDAFKREMDALAPVAGEPEPKLRRVKRPTRPGRPPDASGGR